MSIRTGSADGGGTWSLFKGWLESLRDKVRGEGLNSAQDIGDPGRLAL